MAANEYHGIMYNPPVTAKPCHPPLHKGGFEGAPLDQQGEPFPSSVTAAPCRLYIIVQLPLAVISILIRCAEHHWLAMTLFYLDTLLF